MPAALPASSVRLAFVLAMPPRIANYLANPPTNPPKPWTRTGMTQYVDNDKCVDYVDLNMIVARRRSGKPNPSPIPSLASQAAPSSTPPTPASTGNVAPSPSPSLQRAIHRLYHDTVALGTCLFMPVNLLSSISSSTFHSTLSNIQPLWSAPARCLYACSPSSMGAMSYTAKKSSIGNSCNAFGKRTRPWAPSILSPKAAAAAARARG